MERDAKWWMVLPVVLLVSMIMAELRVVQQEQLFHLACREINATRIALPINITVPGAGAGSHPASTNTTALCKSEEVKRLANFWSECTAIAFSCGAVATASAYGVLSDRYGRKIPLATSIFGNLLVVVVCAVLSYNGHAGEAGEAHFITSWKYILLVSNLVGGLCGGSGITLMGAFAYVTDTNDEKERAHLFTSIEATYGAGGFMMLLAGVFISRATDALFVTFVVLAVLSLATLACVAVIPESNKNCRAEFETGAGKARLAGPAGAGKRKQRGGGPKLKRKTGLSRLSSYHSLSSLFILCGGAIYARPRRLRSTLALICAFCVAFGAFMGVYDAALVVFQAVPYAWGGSQLHLYSAFGAGGRALALFTAPLLRRLASTERSKLRMTQAMFATYALVTLLITATQDLAVICAMNLLAGLTMTTAFGTLRSFFSIGVHASAQGHVLAALSFLQSIIELLAPLVFNNVIQYNTGGMLFWLIAGLTGLAPVLLFAVDVSPEHSDAHIRSYHDHGHEDSENDDDGDDDDDDLLRAPAPGLQPRSCTGADVGGSPCDGDGDGGRDGAMGACLGVGSVNASGSGSETSRLLPLV